MREIIAKKSKIPYIYLFALAAFSIPMQVTLLFNRVSLLRYFGIFSITMLSLMALLFLIPILDMRPAIERVDDTLVIIPLLKRVELKIADISSVKIEELPNQGKKKDAKNKKYQLVIKATVDGVEQSYEMSEIFHIEDAFVRLNQLLEDYGATSEDKA
jgi:hypothetical protein